LNGALKVTLRAGHVSICGSHLRHDEQSPAVVYVLFAQCLLRKFLSGFQVARGQTFLGRLQKLPASLAR